MQATVHTSWPDVSGLVVRNVVSIPPEATDIRVMVSVDDEIVGAFFNGTPISGFLVHYHCPIPDEFRFDVPQSVVQPGQNVVAFYVQNRGLEGFFDTHILAERSARTIITVDDDGPAEFQRIQDAINAAGGGDLVQVAPGTYLENVTLRCVLDAKMGVSLVGAGSTTTTINGGGVGSVVTLVDCDSTTRLQGFAITNGSASFGGGVNVVGGSPMITLNWITGNTARVPGYFCCNGDGGGIAVYNSSPTISDNVITGNTALRSGGGIDLFCAVDQTPVSCGSGAPGGSPLITRNLISGNGAPFGAGIELYRSDAPIVSNNLITGNTAYPFPIGGSGGLGGGVDVYYGSPLVINNTIPSNDSRVGGGIFIWTLSGDTPALVNNILYDNYASGAGGGAFLHVSAAEVANNLFFLNSINDCGGQSAILCSQSGNLVADPRFVSVLEGDYRLRARSPAVDSGLAAGAPPVDRRGQRRPLDGDFDGVRGFDRGAFEYDRDDVLGLRFVSETLLNWEPIPGATFYHVYSGGLATLLSSGLCSSRDGEDLDPTDLAFTEMLTPAQGSGLAYVVTAEVGGTEGSPGWNNQGLERTLALQCP